MRLQTVVLALMAAGTFATATECSNDQTRQILAWEEAAKKHRTTLAPEPYVFEELETMGGYSYLVYFNTKSVQKFARSVLVLMDEKCKIIKIDDMPRESRLILP